MAGDGLIHDDQVSSSAAIAEAKMLFSAGGHAHTGTTDGKLISLLGDLSGNNTAAQVTHIQGRSIEAAAPGVGDGLIWDGGKWANTAGGASTTWNAVYAVSKTMDIDTSALDWEQTSHSGVGFYVHRDLDTINTDDAIVKIANLRSTDQQAALAVTSASVTHDAVVITAPKALKVIGGFDVNSGSVGSDISAVGGPISATAGTVLTLTGQASGVIVQATTAGQLLKLKAQGAASYVHVDDSRHLIDWAFPDQTSATSLKQVEINATGTGKYDIAAGDGTFDALSVNITPNALDDPGSGTLIFSGARLALANANGNADKRALSIGSAHWDYAIHAESGKVSLTDTLPAATADLGGSSHLEQTITAPAINSTWDNVLFIGNRVSITSGGMQGGIGKNVGVFSHVITVAGHASDDQYSSLGGIYIDDLNKNGGSAGSAALRIGSGWDSAIEINSGSVNLSGTLGVDDSHVSASPVSGVLTAGTYLNTYLADITADGADSATAEIYGFHAAVDALGSAVKTAFYAEGANWGYSFLSESGKLKITGQSALAKSLLYLNQGDDDEPFIRYEGISAADQTKNISTVNGDGVVTGPKDFSSSAGWAFVGMVRIDVNGTDYWTPYYSADLS